MIAAQKENYKYEARACFMRVGCGNADRRVPKPIFYLNFGEHQGGKGGWWGGGVG